MASTNRGGEGGKRWPQSSKGHPIPQNYTVVASDQKMTVVAEVVRLLDDGTLVLERDKRPNLFAPGTWKMLFIEEGDE